MTEQVGMMRQLPRYKCHKEVWALKIADIKVIGADETLITPAEVGFAPFTVDGDYMRRHQPTIGGYYVVYADGYKSFSPAQAFEEGYTLIA